MAEAVTLKAETNSSLTFRDFAEYDAAMAIWRYVSPFLILIGTLGSVLSVFILTRKRLRSVTTMFYLLLLACTDIIVLNTGLLRYWLLYSFGYGIRISSSFSCKFHTIMVYLSLDYSSWIVALLSIDRCVCVCLPFRASRINSLRNARVISAVMLILLFSINMHYLWTYDLGQKTIFGSGTECYVARRAYREFIEDVWPWIDFSVVCCFPFTIMIVCTSLIVRQLIQSSKTLRAHKISTASTAVVINNTVLPAKSYQQHGNRNIFVHSQLKVMPKIDQSAFETSDNRRNMTDEPKKNGNGTKKKNDTESKEMMDKWNGEIDTKFNEQFVMDSTEKRFAFMTNVDSKDATKVGSEGNVNTVTTGQTNLGIKAKVGNDLKKHIGNESKVIIGKLKEADPGNMVKMENGSNKTIAAESKRNTMRSRCTSECSAPALQRDHLRLTALQLTINCVFLILMLPITVYMIGYGTWKVSPEPYQEAVLMLLWAVVNMLQYTNNAIHFFLIYMTVPSFRRLFVSMYRRRRSVHPEASVSLAVYR